MYVGRRAPPWRRVLVPFTGSRHDVAALELAGRIAARDPAVSLTVLQVVAPGRTRRGRRGGRAQSALDPARVTPRLVDGEAPVDTALEELQRTPDDLVVIGASEGWELQERLAAQPASMLIVRRGAPVAVAPRSPPRPEPSEAQGPERVARCSGRRRARCVLQRPTPRRGPWGPLLTLWRPACCARQPPTRSAA